MREPGSAAGPRTGGAPAAGPTPPAMVLRLWPVGLFGCVTNVAYYAQLAAAENKDFEVRWMRSRYRDPDMRGDPWAYYFEPVFDDAARAQPGAKPVDAFAHFGDRRADRDHPISPHLVPGIADSLSVTADRALGHALLKRYIRLKHTTQAFIDDFAMNYFDGPMIGLHLRGPGRLHAGRNGMQALLDPGNPVSYAHYFAATDAALEAHPGAKIFACSDSSEVIARIRDRYAGRVLFYPSSRSPYGEMHRPLPENQDYRFSPFKLGLDVIVEAHLLARCVHLVHGNSNIANYALCRAPQMTNSYIYAGVVAQYVAEETAAQAAKP